MTTTRLKYNSVKGLMLFCLFAIMSLKSCMVSAQSSRKQLDELISRKAKAWDDSIKGLKLKKQPLYMGAELSMAVPQYILKSRVAALDGLRVNYLGTNIGGVIGNPIGKLKANVGMYYSEPSVPYTMEMLQGGISGNIYLLRLKKIQYHSFEPYTTVGFSRQQTKFYGNYLPSADNSTTGQNNYSVTDQPLLGKTGFTQMNVGAGIEYQLENCNNLFVHLFAEINYGVLISSNASRTAFSGTRLSTPTTVSLGISFGIIK